MSASDRRRLALERGAEEHYLDASYYDFTYRTRRADIAFYRRVARRFGGPILEVGGGTGRIAIPLLRDGHAVTLLDASAAMLEQAERRAIALATPRERRRLHIVRDDMRSFALDRKFALVIAPFNALLHLYEPDDFARCFRAVALHMRRNARFVFDVRVPDMSELARTSTRVYASRGFRHPTLGHRVKYTERFEYDSLKQVQHVHIVFAPAAGSPRGTRTVETVLSQRQIFPNELRALLALGGLRMLSRHGDFTGRTLAPTDSWQIVTAAKSAGARR